MTRPLDGKVAIITGASARIGKATAIALAEAGAKVAIVARRGDRLESLAQHIAAAGGEALAIVADIMDGTQIQTLIDKTKTTWGQIDILVNNAGIALLGEIANSDPADWRRMIDLNLVALMNLTPCRITDSPSAGGRAYCEYFLGCGSHNSGWYWRIQRL